ncbi:MAG: polysaccharide deacetylase family protein [Azonexus sp.]|jgi:peptidoglycan/xylan/chitin deacetylase (PgdA/CDA1 family)|nr:polysaccharide deacetylase family protein [Azonexus sp.]
MNVHLTFDIEIWCNGWAHLDQEFASCYPRYVYGHSQHGDYALPKTLEILNRYGLPGVFFVEPLFSAKFGASYLEEIVRLIDDAGQETQLHLHPEWTDEIRPAIIADVSGKRQHLTYYTQDEQTALIRHAKALLENALGKPVSAFRAGSYALNEETFTALANNGITVDSSINPCYAISAPELVRQHGAVAPFMVNGVAAYPVSVFGDGFGRQRPAQVGACSFGEMRQALESARDAGYSDFVIVSHNFEMLKPGRADPDFVVVRRFERLCHYLAANKSQYSVGGFGNHADIQPSSGKSRLPRTGMLSTTWRIAEQLVRRGLS